MSNLRHKLAVLLLLCLISCKDREPAKEHHQQNNNEEPSAVTKTGQHIGSTADSTSVDGEPGNPSNN